MSLESNISLLVATLDLTVVKSIRDAIRTADLASGKLSPAVALGPAPNPRLAGKDTFETRRRFHSEPVIEQRVHLHPTPTYERRPIVHSCPRIAEETPVPAAPVTVPATKFSIEPPWRSLPWKNPIPAPDIFVKVIARVHDKNHVGQIIDLFI